MRIVYQYIISLICSLSTLLFVSCGFQQEAGSGSEAGNSTKIAYLDDSLFINIPSSATGDTSTIIRNGLQKASADPLSIYYTTVRGYIEFANEIVHNKEFGLKHLIRVYRDSLPWGIIEKQKHMSDTYGGVKWTALYDENEKYHYQLNIYIDSQSVEKLAFTLAFNGLQDAPAGKVFYRMDLLDPSKFKRPLSILVEFASSGDQKTLDLSLTSANILGDTIEGFKKLKLNLLEKNDVLHFSGASYHPTIMTLLPDTTEYCYLFYGFSDMINNQSVLYIGIPPASINSDSFSVFTEYDLASVLMKKIIRRDLANVNDTIKRFIVTSYTDSMTLEAIFNTVIITKDISWLAPVEKFNTMTLNDFTYFLDINRNSKDSTIVALNWLSMMRQPVYFTGSGYAGNGLTIPDGFKQLASTIRILNLQNPYLVRNLTIGEIGD